jgi:hypothetical protein
MEELELVTIGTRLTRGWRFKEFGRMTQWWTRRAGAMKHKWTLARRRGVASVQANENDVAVAVGSDSLIEYARPDQGPLFQVDVGSPIVDIALSANKTILAAARAGVVALAPARAEISIPTQDSGN